MAVPAFGLSWSIKLFLSCLENLFEKRRFDLDFSSTVILTCSIHSDVCKIVETTPQLLATFLERGRMYWGPLPVECNIEDRVCSKWWSLPPAGGPGDQENQQRKNNVATPIDLYSTSPACRSSSIVCSCGSIRYGSSSTGFSSRQVRHVASFRRKQGIWRGSSTVVWRIHGLEWNVLWLPGVF